MSEWFETAFGEEYLKLYAHRDEAEAQQVVDLIIKATALERGSRVVDAPCGAGRHLQVFQNYGYRAVGADLSFPLLRAGLSRGVASGTVARMDIRTVPFRTDSCDLVVNLFSSLGYFREDEQNLQVVRDLSSLCKRGGWIVIDFMHSEHVRKNLQKTSRRTTSGGATVSDRRWISEGKPRVEKETLVVRPDNSEIKFEESVRLFTPEELRSALVGAGVKIVKEFGSYSGEDFGLLSPRIILVGQRQ